MIRRIGLFVALALAFTGTARSAEHAADSPALKAGMDET